MPRVRLRPDTAALVPASFDRAESPAQLFAELRAFARTRALYPSALPADAPAVAAGRKPLVAESSALSFSCTACGACCRKPAASVLVDPPDLHRMARTLGAPPLLLYPHRFHRALGLFELAALPRGAGSSTLCVGPDLELPITHASGTAPVIFLKLDSASSTCQFALPHERSAPGVSAFGRSSPKSAGDNNGGTTTSSTRSTSGSRNNHGARSGLACSLGPAGMPLACSMYPLGAFFRAEPSGVQFFSVDSPGCEGLGAVGAARGPRGSSPASDAGSSHLTVATYLRGGLNSAPSGAADLRLAAAAWWQRLATAWAVSGIERRAAGVSSVRAAAASLRARGAHAPAWVEAALKAETRLSEAPASGEFLRALREAIAEVWFSPPDTTGAEWGMQQQQEIEVATARLFAEACDACG